MNSRSSACAVHRIDVVRLARHREEHVQQVRAVVEIVARIDERLAERVLVSRGGDRRNLGDDAVGEDLAMARVMDVHRVVIEGRHRGDHARQHRHRVRVVLEAVEESQQRFVDHRVVLDRVHELRQLVAGRQLAVDQQVGDLQEVALLGQLLDRDPTMQQHALVAVDERDAAFAGGGRHEARVERVHAVVAREIRDVQHVRAERAALDLDGRLSCRSRGWSAQISSRPCRVPVLAAQTYTSAPLQSSRAPGPGPEGTGGYSTILMS